MYGVRNPVGCVGARLGAGFPPGFSVAGLPASLGSRFRLREINAFELRNKSGPQTGAMFRADIRRQNFYSNGVCKKIGARTLGSSYPCFRVRKNIVFSWSWLQKKKTRRRVQASGNFANGGPLPNATTPDPWCLLPCSWFLVPGCWSLVPGSLFPGPGSWSLFPRSC